MDDNCRWKTVALDKCRSIWFLQLPTHIFTGLNLLSFCRCNGWRKTTRLQTRCCVHMPPSYGNTAGRYESLTSLHGPYQYQVCKEGKCYRLFCQLDEIYNNLGTSLWYAHRRLYYVGELRREDPSIMSGPVPWNGILDCMERNEHKHSFHLWSFIKPVPTIENILILDLKLKNRFLDINTGKDFLNRFPTVQKIMPQTDK